MSDDEEHGHLDDDGAAPKRRNMKFDTALASFPEKDQAICFADKMGLSPTTKGCVT